MAMSTPNLTGLAALLLPEDETCCAGSFCGRRFVVPVHRESDDRRAWREAVAWLETKQAAREEWPFPW